ncbi:50S ribosomal protein L24 [Candidatus Roizmanbacteria bacterium RIFCSPLOWO2_01_FULL_45_11]|uniref:Large ribosomal subunit protein uL24 n=1 Tax=Candidatus Roizmanbacteria bacterium RIFCSPLOWO2_01_FULL_45_11 TaxID=1802070 RepID=A0A1F7JD89_9BACT|nr:MAG: 50S ribosomal protein L24 [Candidatus Roizmanbacteria bacterium RIFCSPLOWO2_01_FULL_45_11]
MKLKKGDQVLITIGKDRRNKGKVDRLFPEKDAVLVAGMNLYKRHVKKRDDKNPGGVVDISRPLSVGKVQLICPKCKMPTRVGFDVSGAEKHRICKKCKKMID